MVAALVLAALFGPMVLAALSRRAHRASALIAAQVALALLALGLFMLAPVPMPAPPTSWTLPLAAALFLAFTYLLGPLLLRLPAVLGLAGFERGMAHLRRIPTLLLASAILIDGTAEEVLQRAVALPLLAALTGSLVLGAGLTVLGAAAAHAPGWGAGPTLSYLVSGTLLMCAYLASGDLVALILAHILIDTAALLMPRLRRQR